MLNSASKGDARSRRLLLHVSKQDRKAAKIKASRGYDGGLITGIGLLVGSHLTPEQYAKAEAAGCPIDRGRQPEIAGHPLENVESLKIIQAGDFAAPDKGSDDKT